MRFEESEEPMMPGRPPLVGGQDLEGCGTVAGKAKAGFFHFPFLFFSFLASFCFLSLAFSFFPFVSPMENSFLGSVR